MEKVGALLGIKSVRIVEKFLQNLQSVFTVKELNMLENCFAEKLVPNDKDAFPKCFFVPKYRGTFGSFLENVSDMDLYEVVGKPNVQFLCKSFQQKGLHERVIHLGAPFLKLIKM